MLAGCIKIHTYCINTTDYGLVEAVFEAHLVHIVLILAHTNAFGVDLHQFCKRVHKAAANAYRATYGDIFIRKFFPGNWGCGVNTGAIFVHKKYGQAQFQFFDDLFCFAACSAIAYGYCLDVVLFYK